MDGLEHDRQPHAVGGLGFLDGAPKDFWVETRQHVDPAAHLEERDDDHIQRGGVEHRQCNGGDRLLLTTLDIQGRRTGEPRDIDGQMRGHDAFGIRG